MVSDPRILREDAVIYYANTRQLKTQDVRTFAQYLKTLTDIFKPGESAQDQKDNLLGRILPIVRNEAAKYPQLGAADDSYESYVTYLQVVEQKMLTRQEDLRFAKNCYQGKNTQNPSIEKLRGAHISQSGSQFTPRGNHRGRGGRGSSRGRGSHKRNTSADHPEQTDHSKRKYFNCGIPGHVLATCRKPGGKAYKGPVQDGTKNPQT
jgi:hypothetical protein